MPMRSTLFDATASPGSSTDGTRATLPTTTPSTIAATIGPTMSNGADTA